MKFKHMEIAGNLWLKSTRLTVIGVSSAVLIAGFVSTSLAAEELNALVWCDHTDPALIEPFEKQFGVKVNLKEYEGTGAALALVEQSQPGDWDVFVIDGVDVPGVVESGLLAPMPADQLPIDDVFQQVQIDPGDPVVLGSQHPIPLDFSSLWVHTDQSSELGIEPLKFFRDLIKIAGEFGDERLAINQSSTGNTLKHTG